MTAVVPDSVQPQLCPNCNYDIRTRSSNRCPECGFDFASKIGAALLTTPLPTAWLTLFLMAYYAFITTQLLATFLVAAAQLIASTSEPQDSTAELLERGVAFQLIVCEARRWCVLALAALTVSIGYLSLRYLRLRASAIWVVAPVVILSALFVLLVATGSVKASVIDDYEILFVVALPAYLGIAFHWVIPVMPVERLRTWIYRGDRGVIIRGLFIAPLVFLYILYCKWPKLLPLGLATLYAPWPELSVSVVISILLSLQGLSLLSRLRRGHAVFNRRSPVSPTK